MYGEFCAAVLDFDWFAVAFDVYDANGDGHLSLEEMTKMISAAFAMVLNAGDDAQVIACAPVCSVHSRFCRM